MKDYMAINDYFSSDRSTEKLLDSNDNEQYPKQPLPATIPVTMEGAIIDGVIDITKETIRCFTEYAKCKEHEETERKRITATLKAIKYKIDAQKEVYLKELNSHFAERKQLYDLAERVQEKALKLGDKEMLQLCYNFILNIYNKPVGLNCTTTSLISSSDNLINVFE